jgi:hypothetical protein
MRQPTLFDCVTRPNLFRFASSERCQDAFLCWLLSWAHRKHRKSDEPLHVAGRALMDRLIALCGIAPPNVYKEVMIHPQYKGIDILALVNDEIALLIEDKIDSCEHSNQLRRYPRIVRRDFPGTKVAPVYLKTGLPAYGERDLVREAGFHFYPGRDLLAVLEEGKKLGVNNATFIDFLLHLRSLDRLVIRRALRARGPRRPKCNATGTGFGLFASTLPGDREAEGCG